MDIFILCGSLLLILTTPTTSFTPHMEDVQHGESGGLREIWGFVEVRPGVHMFWWLYYTTHPDGYQNRPWIIWLQGGPGLSGTAIGNFLEIGAFNENLLPRNTTWVQEASVMYVDNPAGVGFSYIQNSSLVAVDMEEVSSDMLLVLQVFLEHFNEFRSSPLFLFGQSYGGKFLTHLGYTLQKEKLAGKLDINLRGLGIGNGFVSPLDMALHYANYLFQFGLIDDTALNEYNQLLPHLETLVLQEKWNEAESHFFAALSTLGSHVSPGMDYYNVLHYYDARKYQTNSKRALTAWNSQRPTLSIYSVNLEPLMNGHIKEKLNIPYNIIWGGSHIGEKALEEDFMKDTIYAVDWLLQNSDVEISVYEGQLDLLCETSGALAWINRLTWSGLSQFQSAKRRFLLDPDSGQTEMFVKSHDTLKFYWILNSGHAVPADAPYPALRMLRRILDNEDH